MSALRLCSTAGCGRRVTGGRCVQHQRARATGVGGTTSIAVGVQKDLATASREINARRNSADEKWCCSCRQFLPFESFLPNPAYRDGVESWCRACHAGATREWRRKNPEYIERYNASRRIGPRESECVDCGVTFTAGARGPASSRCPNCRRQRKLEQRRVHKAA
jgi:hypothetical protein